MERCVLHGSEEEHRSLDCAFGTQRGRGIVGIGPTVEAALRAFEVQYLRALKPPAGDAQERKLNAKTPQYEIS
jgi:hypothetical protein